MTGGVSDAPMLAGYEDPAKDCANQQMAVSMTGSTRSADVAAHPSNSSSARLRSNPPAYPVSAPPAPSTRWQGTTTDTGLRPTAAPTALAAAGLPMAWASSP